MENYPPEVEPPALGRGALEAAPEGSWRRRRSAGRRSRGPGPGIWREGVWTPHPGGSRFRVKIVNNKDDDDVGVNISSAKIGNVILLVSGSASRLHRMTGQM